MSRDDSNIITPEQHLGFEVGEDRKLADWPQIVEYFHMLAGASDRVQTVELGQSTEGNPLILVAISSAGNLRDLESYRQVQAKLADPRLVADAGEAEELVARGKTVVMVTCGIHATEAGATQMSMLLGHHLASSDDPSVKEILDNVILLLVPCLNPDGLISVKGWYDSTVGTQHEGVSPPFLYHKYAGHDNNRDWFMFALPETKVVVERCLNVWHPQIVFDLHQTRINGMRMILPPFIDPVGPNVHPLLQAQQTTLGAAMASALTARGKSGVAVNMVYDAYSPSRTYVYYHGGVRVLSEAAGAKIATPVNLTPGDLKTARGEDPMRRSWNHPMPWEGGRWGLPEIVDYEFDAVMACLDHAARYRDTWLRNFYEVGVSAVSGGRNPYAYVVPRVQRDPGAVAEMLQVMEAAGVEVHEATDGFSADGKRYPAGTRVLLMAQPYGAFTKTMLESEPYPDLRAYPGGPPKAPYDVTAHSLPLLMGVDVVEVRRAFQAELQPDNGSDAPRGVMVGRKNRTGHAYLLSAEANASARVVNRLMRAGVEVGRTRKPARMEGGSWPAGTYVIEGGPGVEDVLSDLTGDEAHMVEALDNKPRVSRFSIRTPRVGVYRSYVPTAEEGWTRLVLEEYGFRFTSLVDRDVRQGALSEKFDAILLPHQSTRQIHHGHNSRDYPSEYAGGLGKRGASSLKAFVQQGGTLIACDGAAEYAIAHLDLPASNALAGAANTEFYGPGSLLSITLDPEHPIAYGLPSRVAVMFFNSPAFEVYDGRVVGRYPRHNPLLCGWLVGPEKLFGRAALASIPLGRGEVVLIGFRPHFRAQARGTYRILFNALFHSTAGS